jgi:zinc protease
MRRDPVAGFYRSLFTPSNTVLAIAGDADPARVLQLAERHYGALPRGDVTRDRGPAEPDRTGFRWQEIERDVEHSQIVLGWRTVTPAHQDAAPLYVAAAVLGAGRASRLYREVRERSLASAITAYQYAPTELGVFVVAAEAPPERSGAAVRAAWAQVRELAAAGPGVAELERIRRGIESRWGRSLESMEGQATYLAGWEALGGWELGAAHREAMLTASPATIAAATARYLVLDRTALVTMRPSDADAFAADLPAARAQLADEQATVSRRREAGVVEAPTLVGFGTLPEQVTANVAVFRTDGGVPILVRQKPGAPIAYIEAVFAGGVCDETEARAGRTILIARTALQGTAHRDGPQFSEEIESIGAAIGVVIGHEAFGWTVSVPTAQLGPALALLAEVVEQPALNTESLETERTIALAGLARMRDDMMRHPFRLALETAFRGHAYGRPALGSETGLRGATQTRLRAWHERRVRNGRGALVVVADAPPDEIAAAVRGAFRGLTHGTVTTRPAPSWPVRSLESVERRDRAQTALALVLPGPARADRRRHALGLVTTVASGLGGRVFEALRERESLAYAVSVSMRTLRTGGWLSAYIACAPAKEEAARAGLMRELIRLAEAPVDPEELERARAYTLGALAIRQQSAASVLSDIADAWMFGSLDELDAVPRIIAGLQLEDLQAAARASIDPARAVWGIVRASG